MKKIPIELNFKENGYSNESFTMGKCYVAYHGENRNGSYISKESFEKALPSILGCPIVGEYIAELENDINTDMEGNMTDHDGLFRTPQPYGFVSPTANYSWEIGQDGREYLFIDEIVLWTGRYPEAKYIVEKSMNQSMEIQPIGEGGYFSETDGLYHIIDFSFEALCVLNTDRIRKEDGTALYKGKNDTEPCFENSHFETYSIKDKFKQEYEEMLKEFKQFSLSLNKELKEKSDKDEKIKINPSTENFQNNTEVNNNIMQEEVKVEEVVTTETVEQKEEFVAEVEVVAEDTEQTEEVVDEEKTEEDEEFKECKDENKYELTAEEFNTYQELINSKSVLENEKIKLEQDFKALEEKFEVLTAEKETVQGELDTYKLKEKQEIINQLFSKDEFSCLVETEDFKSLQEKAIEMELDIVEEKLFVMLGKFSALNFSKKEEEKSNIMSFGIYKYEPKDNDEPDYSKKWCAK